MVYDDSPEAAVREYLAGAGRALERGDLLSVCKELITALGHAYSIERARISDASEEYRMFWDGVAGELSRLSPSLLRRAEARSRRR